ncbi:MAG: hypothetical protein HY288_19810 [Planctomycetia bacterium]|nr:hypothetical protein [Planctomycetia bacterium]
MQIIPIEALFAERLSTGPRAALAKAEVIIGVDVPSQRQFTLFGTPALEESVQIGKRQALRTVRIEFNAQTGDLDKLVALIQLIKGRRDYLATDE